ncbi:MAG: tetratricopeptide repeat protein [Hyphomicrobiales bacterium]
MKRNALGSGIMAHRGRLARPPARRRTLVCATAAMVMAVSLAGCLRGKDDAASALDGVRSQDALHAEAVSWSARYGANPGEKTASLGYARVLSALDQKGQAAAVLQAAAVKSPKDTEILAAYGKALVDTGDYNQALEVLARAHSPDRPDWHVLSAEGIASDGVGLHDRAQSFYLSALKIAPGEPGVMSNLGLSYALSKKLPEAERVLTEAAQSPKADARVRQNLALVLALQGRFDNANQTLRHDLSPADAANNVAEIRSMIAQPNTWDAIRGKGQPRDAPTTAISRGNAASPAAALTALTQAPE